MKDLNIEDLQKAEEATGQIGLDMDDLNIESHSPLKLPPIRGMSQKKLLDI